MMPSHKVSIGKIIPCGNDKTINWVINHFQSWNHFLKCNILKSPRLNYSYREGYLFLHVPESGSEGVSVVFKMKGGFHKTHVKISIKTAARGLVEAHSGYTNAQGVFCAEFEMTAFQMFAKTWIDEKDNGSLSICCDLRPPEKKNTKDEVSSENSGRNSDSGEEEAPSRKKRKRTIKTEGSSENIETDSDSEIEEEETFSQKKSFKKLKKDLQRFLVNAEGFDVTIQVQGREFRAHRAILCARCPVFRSMFAHDMIEKAGEVVIEDCDPDAFQDFLDHVYSGNLKRVCAENVFGLFALSDKYGMLDLRQECLDFLAEQLSVDLFCKTVILAERHEEKALLDLATLFFYQYSDDIVETAEWQTFMVDHTATGAKFFREALKMSKENLNADVKKYI